MIPRQPVPWPTDVPTCYGVQHDAATARCQACVMAPLCAPATVGWAAHTTLAAHVVASDAVLETALTHAGRDAEDPVVLYAALYRKHFGTYPRHYRGAHVGPRLRVALAKAIQICTTARIPLADFLEAQMHVFRHVRDSRRVQAAWIRTCGQFPVNWIGGPGALGRYRETLHADFRKYRRAHVDAEDLWTAVGRLRLALWATESAVVEDFVTHWRLEGTATWEAAVGRVAPALDWRALEYQGDAPDSATRQRWGAWHTRVGLAVCRVLKRDAQLHAAQALADRWQQGLSTRIGFRLPWSWPSFARLLTHLCGGARTAPLPTTLAGVGGRWWGTHRRTVHARH
jgi:hypothetical protein